MTEPAEPNRCGECGQPYIIGANQFGPRVLHPAGAGQSCRNPECPNNPQHREDPS